MLKPQPDSFNAVLKRVASLKVDVWPSKFDVEDEEGIFRLLRYHPQAPTRFRNPILIVYAFINRPYVLDMNPDISVVQKYLKAGFEVYMIDWGYPTISDESIDLDDYIDYIDRSAEKIRRKHSLVPLNLHGYCLGGSLSVVYAALQSGSIKNLMLQAAPVDFFTDNLIARWARALDPDKMVEAFHNAPGVFLNAGFLLVDPVNLIIGKYGNLMDMIESDEGVSSFLRMDHWIFDSPAIPGRAFSRYIKDWYHENSMVKGEFKVLGRKVDLSRIDVPVLVLAAKFDHIVPPASQRAILDHISSKDKQMYEMEKGHIGITTSRDSHREFWPRVVKWLEDRSDRV